MGKVDDSMLSPVFVPDNVIQRNRIWGLKLTGIIEGCIEAAIFDRIIWSIPFVLKVKIIICIVCSLTIFFVNAVGIHGNSLIPTLINRAAYKPLIRRFSYRRLSPDCVYEEIIDDNGRLKAALNAISAESLLDKINSLRPKWNF